MCWDELEGQKIRIAFGTLWADGGHSLEEQAKVGQGLADFYLIQKDGRRFTVQDMMVWHKKQKAALVSFLRQEYDGKTIVITHHMPSYRLCHPRFGNEINGGFAADCDDILASDYAPDIWVHGHTHDQINRQLDRTRVVCNPRGYTREWETEFNKFGANPVFIDL
jgi:predicted phosphodiesterase